MGQQSQGGVKEQQDEDKVGLVTIDMNNFMDIMTSKMSENESDSQLFYSLKRSSISHILIWSKYRRSSASK